MVDSHSRLLLLLVDLHILLVLVALDICSQYVQTRTVDSSHLFSHTLLHLGKLALNICSQYGRLFCSLLVLAYFLLHLGRLALDICSQYGRLAQQTRIFYFTRSLDICSQYGRLVLLHLGRLALDICSQYVRLAQQTLHTCSRIFYFTWVDSHQTSVYTQQTRIFYFTCSLDICSQYGRLAFTYGRLVLLYLGRLALDQTFLLFTLVHNMVDSFALYLFSHILLHLGRLSLDICSQYLFNMVLDICCVLNADRLLFLCPHCKC